MDHNWLVELQVGNLGGEIRYFVVFIVILATELGRVLVVTCS